jgi:hypothetical protein
MERWQGRLGARYAFAVLAVLWPAAMLFATRIAALPRRGTAAYLASAAVYFSGSLLCHQRPERSFHLWTAQFPVCARCAGIYAGAALGAVIGLLMRQPREIGLPLRGPSSSLARARLALAAAAFPSALTLVYEWSTGVMPAHWIRALSGVVLGSTAAFVVVRAGAAPVREVN